MPPDTQPAAAIAQGSPLRRRLDAFTTAFRDFWRGYWSAAEISCG